jgi:Collagen triple helix repeat (20 copies)
MTYANVVATLALIFAMTGSAVAATHYLITSSKQISPKVLKELKAPGKAGATGPAGTPGTQGPRGANGANGANGIGVNGTNGLEGEKGEHGLQGTPGLEGETGPEGPEGGTSAALKRWRKSIAVAGKGKAATVSLLTVGPFEVVGHCEEEAGGGETIASTFIVSSEAGAFAAEPEEGEQIALPVGKAVSITPEAAEGEPEEPVFKGPNGGLFSAETKTGTIALDGASNEGVFLSGESGPACFFSGYAVVEN